MNDLAPLLAAALLAAIILTVAHIHPEKADHKEAAPAEQPQPEAVQTDVEIGRIKCVDTGAVCREFVIYRSIKE